jgi:hypothetical protein
MPSGTPAQPDDARDRRVNWLKSLWISIPSLISGQKKESESIAESVPLYHERLLTVYRELRVREVREKEHFMPSLPGWAQAAIDLNVLTSDRLEDDPRWPDVIEKLDGHPQWQKAIDALGNNPRLQEAVAAVTAYTPSKWLLERELSVRGPTPPADEEKITSAADIKKAGEKSWSPDSGEDVYDAAAAQKLHGLCFSGGGIRSATFCLGVLQALADFGNLGKFDYLSTVSGGGYIHQWLASWIHNDPDGFESVGKKLIPLPAKDSPARIPEQIMWLRRYSSYLTPQRGILSADTWMMIAIWFRNTFLNQIVLFAFLGCCLLAVRGITYPFLLQGTHAPVLSSQWGWLLVAVAIVSGLRLASALAWQTGELKTVKRRPPGALGNEGVFWWLVVPGFTMSVLVALEATGKICVGQFRGVPILFLCWIFYLVCIVFAVTFGGAAIRAVTDLKGNDNWKLILTAITAFFITAIACIALSACFAWYLSGRTGSVSRLHLQHAAHALAAFLNQHLNPSSQKLKAHEAISGPWTKIATYRVLIPSAGPKSPPLADYLLAVFAPIVFFFLQFLAVRLQLGILGRYYTESRREWLARLGAWSAMLSCSWIVLGVIVRLGPVICHWFLTGSNWRWFSGIVSTIAVHAVTLYSGGSSKTDGKPKPNTFFGYSALDIVGIVGAPICILVLLLISASLINSALVSLPSEHPVACPLLFFAIVFAVFGFFGWRVDVNEFSLHGFYRNRLARCYLGGTNPKRTPDPFTGFDDHTETANATNTTGIALSDLLPAKFGATDKEGQRAYDGPFPIFCSTLNLTFGEDLAWQERKGASFAFTPLYSGYHVGWTAEDRRDPDTNFNGYVPTKEYAYRNDGIRLSTVTAISGAALSPNQGFSSQPALAFLMTFFNVRLGWWIANPRKWKIWPSKDNSPTPSFGMRYLLSELFGLADDTSNYVCLCDGGKFENMGVYELVRRRCKLIVICDAEQDEGTNFEGIGNAVARCRTDFGAEISLDLNPLIPNALTGLADVHYVTGTIRYPAPPGGNGADPKYMGKVIYLKTSITGDETADLLHHRRVSPEFPQDSTMNQWFNESTFESYRRLGQLIAEEACYQI